MNIKQRVDVKFKYIQVFKSNTKSIREIHIYPVKQD